MEFRIVRFAFLSLVIFFIVGCALYAHRIARPRSLIERGDFEPAIEELTKLAARKDNDELLYLMDLGIAYHRAGKYKEAIETFLKADTLMEIKDYTSLSEEAATVLLSDEAKKYRGEDFEKILINVYLAIDYTLLRQWDDALVECRRVNHKLDRMISEGQLPYEHNAFAKYLAAVLFEARREYNDAFVDYRQLLKWADDFPYLGVGLLRMADRLKASEEFADYRKRYADVKDFRLEKGHGEVILLLEQGLSPVKRPHPNFRLLPKFYKRFFWSDYVWLSTDTGERFRSYPLFDIESTAITELDNRIDGILAKKIAGIAVKETAGFAVEKATKSELAGFLAKVFLYASDSADLRSWTTLPARLQLLRMKVKAGRHNLSLDMVETSGQERKNIHQWEGVEVKSGEYVFLNYRTRD